MAGASTTYQFGFTTVSNWNANTGCLYITFPTGYTFNSPAVTAFSGPGGTGPAPGAGGLGAPTIVGQQLRFTRDGTGQGGAMSQGAYSITLSGIINPTTTGTTGTFAIGTLQTAGCGTAVDNGNAPAVTITPAALGSFSWSSVPSTATAGSAFTMTATAKDLYDNVKTNYLGSASFASSDGAAILPSTYTFVAGDAGVHTFTSGFTLKTTGSQLVTVTDGTSTGTTPSIAVDPAAFASFDLSGEPASTMAGTAFTLTLAAKDTYGNVKTDFVGTAAFTSTDGAAILPSAYAFVPGDNGIHAFTLGFTLKTTGTHTVTATSGAVSDTTASITVTPAPLAGFVWSSVPGSVTSGMAFSMTVTATDAYANTKTDYTGSVTFTSSDGAATLPGTYTFVAGDAGVRTLAFTLQSSGGQTVTVTAGTTTKTTSSINVVGLLQAFQWSLAPSAVAGASFTMSVTAKDSFGNTKADYAGTVSFASTDPAANLPASYAFTPSDSGVRTFSFTLKTVGTQTITVADGGIAATTSGIPVSPGPLGAFAWSGVPASVTAGTTTSMTVTAKDAYGNVKTDYSGPVTFTSTDVAAVLPTTYAYSAGEAGVHSFLFTLKTAGSRTVTALAGPVSQSTAGILVNPAAATGLAFNPGPPATCPKGAACAPALKVEARDAYGNVDTTFSGSVSLSKSAGPAGTLSGTTATIAAGVASFPALSMDRSGTGFRLTADSCPAPPCGLTAATSAPFIVTGPVALTFDCATVCQQPSHVDLGSAIAPAVKVAALRDDGSVATEFAGTVSVSFAVNPGAGTLFGTTLVNAVSGVASFGALWPDTIGAGYALSASTSTGISGATSAPFNVRGAPDPTPDCYAVAGSLAVAAPGVVGNDVTWDGRMPSARLHSPPLHAESFALRSDGSFSYVPTGGFEGEDSFSYVAFDGTRQAAPTLVCLLVTHGSLGNTRPIASFTFAPSAPTTLTPVVFADGSSDVDGAIASWSWSFGDGQTADGAYPTHLFDAPGEYIVTLQVRDDQGLLGMAAQVVKVVAAGPLGPEALVSELTPPPAIEGDDPAPSPAPRQAPTSKRGNEQVDIPPADRPGREGFMATAQGADLAFAANETLGTQYHWTFGDGDEADGLEATHTYAKAGTFTVTLSFRDASGALRTSTRSVTVVLPADASRDEPRTDVLAAPTSSVPPLVWIGLAGVVAAFMAGVFLTVVLMKRRKA